MANFSTNEFRAGLKVMLDGDPCSIMDNELVKPGKGQAFNRVRLRNLKTGRQWERTFKSGESLEAQMLSSGIWSICIPMASSGISWNPILLSNIRPMLLL